MFNNLCKKPKYYALVLEKISSKKLKEREMAINLVA